MLSLPPALLARIRRRTLGIVAVVVAGLLPLVNSATTPAVAAGVSTPVGTVASPAGYWLVASDGGIFSFGDARFFGSTGAIHLNQPITGMAATPSGNGYWLVASDGGIFSFGDASFFGAAPSRPAHGPRSVVAMVPRSTGAGYWQASTTGELLAFGDAPDFGGASNLNRPIVGMAAIPAAGGKHGVGNPGSPATPTTTTPTTAPPVVTPGTGPQTFSSAADVTWGTMLDPNRPPYAGRVDALAEVGDKMFIAGEFTNIADPNAAPAAPPQPYLAVLDAHTGVPISGSTFNATANPDGNVYALEVSPDGHRLYVGGTFNHIGGHAAQKLAALNLDTGAWDSTFNPPTPNAYVRALALSNGRLYIGGAFQTLTSGSPVNRSEVAELDAQTGALVDTFNPPQNYGGVFSGHGGTPTEDPPGTVTPTPGNVRALQVMADGKTLMVGGDFLHFGTTRALDPTHQHGGLIALDAATGALTPWQPVNSRPVFDFTLWPGDSGKTVFAAAGGAGGVVESFLPGGNTKPQWTGHVDGDGRAVAATTTRVYLVGHYNHEVANANDPCLTLQPGATGINCPNGTLHNHLAAFEAKTGNLDPSFTAQADTPEGPEVAIIGAHNLWVGGNFARVKDNPGAPYRSQPGLARYPANG
jgi:hypothetical protein